LRGIGLIIYWILLKPLELIWRWLFRYVILKLYIVYFPIKRRIVERLGPVRNRFLFLFSSRFVIHLMILCIAAGVTINSLRTREVSAEEFGSGSLVVKFLNNSSDATVVEETSDTQLAKPVSYASQKGLVGSTLTSTDTNGTDTESDSQVSLAQGGSAIIKPNMPTTDATEQDRNQVEYYVVEGGDTVSTIAQKFGISTDTILQENRLGVKDYIKPGEKLTILPMSGVSHQVKKGDTVASLAKLYSVDSSAIIDFNKLASADDIKVGDILIVPGGEAPEVVTPKPTLAQSRAGQYQSSADNSQPLPPVKVSASQKMVWPTSSHKINQYFRRGHTGVDIDGDIGSPIYAAEGGRAATVGWNKGGYGLYIILEHADGRRTLYGHLSKTFITAGQQVSKGQNIANMGNTGRSTGPHLHFEVISGGRKLNPLSYL
jgi:murein DD-endopeptidase MepM/ murein hydrolase activator NlpD